MTKVCNKVIEFGFNYLGLDTIDISHSVDNIGSKRVIEKCGFRYIDKVFKEKYNIYVDRYKMKKKK